jgi:hypothetical protein
VLDLVYEGAVDGQLGERARGKGEVLANVAQRLERLGGGAHARRRLHAQVLHRPHLEARRVAFRSGDLRR